MKDWRELLAALSVTAALAGMVLPAMGRGYGTSRAVECLSNKRILINAWAAFALERNGELAGGGVNEPSDVWNPKPWATGVMSWTERTSNTNLALLMDGRNAALGLYVEGKPWAFRCPADNYISKGQAEYYGWTSRVRSVSASSMIGGGYPGFNPDDLYARVTTLGGFVKPGAALTYVFVDEHPDYIEDPTFVSPGASRFMDAPAGHHSGATGFAFADGHCELKLWESDKTTPPVSAGGGVTGPTETNPADAAWLRDRTPRP